MKVELLNYTQLNICSKAIRTCWDSHSRSDNGGPKDQELIDRVGNKNKHSSTLEHLVYTFFISDISRAVLQELARHRMASLSVKSTRYTLKELKEETSFIYDNGFDHQFYFDKAKKYVVLTGILEVDKAIVYSLDNLRQLIKKGIKNDKAKYALPDAYKTELTWTINLRSLQNFLELRTGQGALWEIRDLAYMIYDNIPSDHKYLVADYIYKND